jgi:SET domain-containing protein
VFAIRTIRKGAKILEYRGARLSESAADAQPIRDPANPHHTFLFQLSDGTIIDGGTRGNSARWINHSCQPNCESVEYDDGTLFIHARRTIHAGEELCYDYRIAVWVELPAAIAKLTHVRARARGAGERSC